MNIHAPIHSFLNVLLWGFSGRFLVTSWNAAKEYIPAGLCFELTKSTFQNLTLEKQLNSK